MTIFHVIKYGNDEHRLLADLPYDVLEEYVDTMLEMLIDLCISANTKENVKEHLLFDTNAAIERQLNANQLILDRIKIDKNNHIDSISDLNLPKHIVYLVRAINCEDSMGRYTEIAYSYQKIERVYVNFLN